ncbi:hypothetical protein CCMA1212_006447 [Trichoderma ghanense]|uniref:Uncharacterized protein n=1 Tax=Trichoderma ghanense TaxID=65468 RepID=A0ABY2H0Q4_9HYPO
MDIFPLSKTYDQQVRLYQLFRAPAYQMAVCHIANEWSEYTKYEKKSVILKSKEVTFAEIASQPLSGMTTSSSGIGADACQVAKNTFQAEEVITAAWTSKIGKVPELLSSTAQGLIFFKPFPHIRQSSYSTLLTRQYTLCLFLSHLPERLFLDQRGLQQKPFKQRNYRSWNPNAKDLGTLKNDIGRVIVRSNKYVKRAR